MQLPLSKALLRLLRIQYNQPFYQQPTSNPHRINVLKATIVRLPLHRRTRARIPSLITLPLRLLLAHP